jgi:hypothetical protein
LQIQVNLPLKKIYNNLLSLAKLIVNSDTKPTILEMLKNENPEEYKKLTSLLITRPLNGHLKNFTSMGLVLSVSSYMRTSLQKI